MLDYIEVARGEGATVALGGEPATRPECGTGWFVEPTILTGVRNDMRIAQEEVFGPVLAVIPFKDEDHAVRDSQRQPVRPRRRRVDPRHRPRIPDGRRIKSGTVWVNTYAR